MDSSKWENWVNRAKYTCILHETRFIKCYNETKDSSINVCYAS